MRWLTNCFVCSRILTSPHKAAKLLHVFSIVSLLLTIVVFWPRLSLFVVVYRSEWKPTPACPYISKTPLLCIFTSFKPDERKFTANNNTVHNWALLDDKCEDGQSQVRPIMYVANMTSSSPHDQSLMTSAKNLGWTLLPVPRFGPAGLPFVKEMYSETASRFPNCTFYGMSNGDILFNDGLVDSLQAVAKKLDTLGRTLVIGQRWNVRWQKDHSLYFADDVTRVALEHGKLDRVDTIDYFMIARNEFPWQSLPDVVIARQGYDNYIVLLAVQQNVSVVDVTNTLVAVHQTDEEAVDPDRHTKEDLFNLQHLPKVNLGLGLVNHSQFVAERDHHSNPTSGFNDIEILRRLNGDMLLNSTDKRH